MFSERFRGALSTLLNEVRGNYVLIIFFGFLAHGLLLLNDGVYWDGWLIYAGKFLDRWDLIEGIYADRGGLPIYTVFHWVLYQSPAFVFGYKLVAFVFILGSALLVYTIAIRLIDNKHVALFLALIGLTYPANQAIVELIVIPYLLSYFLFWLGCLFVLLAAERASKGSLWLHAAAIVSLVLSFRMYSLLVYFYGFLGLVFIAWCWQRRGKLLEIALSFIRKFAIYLILPVLFWFGNALFFPPSGPYANSDAFIFDPVVFGLAETYWTYGFVGQLIESLKNLANPVALLLVVISVLLAAKANLKDQPAKKASKLNFTWLVLGGMAFFVAGILPYAVVGRSVQLHGWATRNAVLISVPVAMILTGLVFQAFKSVLAKHSLRASIVVLTILTLLFATETIKFYLDWQLRTIKDYSVIANFKAESDITDHTSVFLVYDDFRAGGEPKYRPYEYFGMFALAKPEKDRIGFDVNFYTYSDYFLTGNSEYEKLYDFWFPRLDKNGCQAEMHVERGEPEIDMLYFTRYFYYRYLDPAKLDSYLRTLTDLKFAPAQSPYATNCTF